MDKVQEIATELGEIKPDQQWLEEEINRLNRENVLPLEHVRDLHNWLDAKKKQGSLAA